MPIKFRIVSFLLNFIPNLNQGGCLCAAWYLHHLFGCDIVQLSKSDRKEEYLNNKAFVEGKSDNAGSATHFGVTFDKGITIYDCMGIIRDSYKYKLLIPSHKAKEFTIKALSFGDWNKSFKRNTFYYRILTKSLNL